MLNELFLNTFIILNMFYGLLFMILIWWIIRSNKNHRNLIKETNKRIDELHEFILESIEFCVKANKNKE